MDRQIFAIACVFGYLSGAIVYVAISLERRSSSMSVQVITALKRNKDIELDHSVISQCR
jgi:hypothetical protein